MDLSQLYPKWKYHQTESACMVADPAEEIKLGPGWADHPNDFLDPGEDSGLRTDLPGPESKAATETEVAPAEKSASANARAKKKS
jgi:hypothetical protein